MKRSTGFTLIELMITVAVIAILAAIAYPSYMRHIVRANRVAAEGYMLEVSGLQQRYLLDARSYAADLASLNTTPPANVASNYTVATAPNPPASAPGFTVTATPINSQLTKDAACGTLTVDEAGKKTPTGSGSRCW
jgi:type IV pilus assembly protein PilE